MTSLLRHSISPQGDGYMGGSCHYNKKAGRWFVQVRWQGKTYQIWRYNGEPIWHEKTAIKLLNKIRSEVDDKTFQPKFYFPESPLSMRVYSMRWLTLINVKPNTLKDYRYSVRRFIIPFFGDMDIRKIRHSDIVEFQKSINRCEKGRYNVVSCLKTMMRWAWRNEDIVKVPPFPKITQGQLPEVKYLSLEQQEKALQAIVPRHRAIFQIGMEYGLRIGEMRALQWDCVSEDKIIIKRAFAENQLMETTKTGLIRESLLTPYAKEIIKSLPMTGSIFVFVREDGKPYTDKNLNTIWKTACAEAKIEPIKLYNAVRHSLGCQLLDLGIDMDIVQKQLGHTDARMTQRYTTRSEVKMTEALIKRRASVVEFPYNLHVKNGDVNS